MDVVLTIDLRCFSGFPTSKSSSSRSCGYTAGPEAAALPALVVCPVLGQGYPVSLSPTLQFSSPHSTWPHMPSAHYLPLHGIITGLLLRGEAFVLLFRVVICRGRGRYLDNMTFAATWPSKPWLPGHKGGMWQGPQVLVKILNP